MKNSIFFKTLKSIFNRFINLGSHKEDSLTQSKKIRLLNIFCLVWHFRTLLEFIEDFFIPGKSISAILFDLFIMLSIVITIQLLQYKRKFIAARLLFVLSIILLVYTYANHIYTQELLEYYFLLVPGTTLIFIDNKKINFSIIIVSFFLMLFPNYYFNHYTEGSFNDLSVVFLYFGVFIMINYFKNLNTKNELALEQKTEELKNLNAFQSQFFINISHEIRTPITLMNGQIQRLPATSKQEGIIIKNKLNEQVLKITQLVNDVLDLSKMEASSFVINKNPLNFSRLIDKLYANFSPLFKQKNIKFILKRITKNYYVEGNIPYLEKAITNIIVNALKYTKNGGSVFLTITKNTSEVILDIKDSGIGIERKNLNKIFQRFYQIDTKENSAGGTGIGLSFTKEIINLHNGIVTVKSTINEGSNFRIKLPLVNNITIKQNDSILHENLSVSETKITFNLSSDQKILLVDDHEEMRSYLKYILGNQNYIEADNGIDALQKLKKNKVAIVITDYMMPQMDGLELIKKIKERNYNTPILMLTARGDAQSKLNVLRLGIDDYIQKPFDSEELLIKIQHILKNQNSKNQYLKENIFNNSSFNKNDIVDTINKYVIENSINHNLNQDDIVDYLQISKSSLYRKVKAITGLTPNELITEIKLQKARQIVENNTNITLKQLAKEVGFKHSSYFSKLYISRFGKKPH